jgi:hypothetical protein
MFFHLADGTEHQKLLPAIQTRTSHENHTPVTFSSSGDFVFLAALIHTLSLSHCSCSFQICAENTKGPMKLGLSKPSFDTLLPHSNYTEIAPQKPLKMCPNVAILEKLQFNTCEESQSLIDAALSLPRFS